MNINNNFINNANINKTSMHVLSPEHINVILKYADICTPSKCNTKYSNEYYLTNIIHVLKDVVTWRSLQILKFENKPKNHYKTISKMHRLWSKCNVYNNAFNEIINSNSKCKITNNLFIDGTLIINKNGKESIGYGCGESRKKKYTSITLVCNNDVKPISILSSKANTKILTKNNKTKTIKTLPHDSKSIESSISNINSNKTYNLIGDSGYLINEKRKALLPKNVTIIAPKRKNQKIKTKENEKTHLKRRYIVENMFAVIKRYNKIHIRRDSSISAYMGFFMLGCIFII